MKLLSVALLAVLTGCATERGNIRHAQHGADQIKMIAVQREARLQEKQAKAQMNVALVQALAQVAQASPDQAGSVAVALAVIGVRGSSVDSQEAPTIALQQQRSDALEWTKALAPAVGGLITGVGIAAINAETQRNASDNNRDILLGDQVADRGIVEAVAGLGSVAAAQTGIEVGGDYYDLEDSASVDNSIATTTSQDTTTTTQTTTTSSYSMDTTIDYQGTNMTLSELVTALKSAGATYSIDLNNDGVADVSGGDGTTSITEIDCQLTFGPTPPQCQ
jgi:hypothetical protein